MGRVAHTSSNDGIQVKNGPYIAVGDIYAPNLEFLRYTNDNPFKIIQVYLGSLVVVFLNNGRETTLNPSYLLKNYRKLSPVELTFYDNLLYEP